MNERLLKREREKSETKFTASVLKKRFKHIKFFSFFFFNGGVGLPKKKTQKKEEERKEERKRNLVV